MTPELRAQEWRRELAAELPYQLHVEAGESMAEGPSGKPVKPKTNGHPATWTGLPFAHQFDRYLSGEHGGDFLATDAFTEVRDWCRREHYRETHTGPDPFAWNLCARLVIAYVELRQPMHHIAASEDIDQWLTRNLLTAALEYAATWRSERRAGVTISDTSRLQLNESEPLQVVLAREHSVAHEERVWGMWRERFPYLPPWESELEKRRVKHALHCHGRCALLMNAA